MCGMFGIISGETRYSPAIKYMRDGFLAGQVRGTDSSGIIQIDAKGDLLTHRAALAGTTFLQDSLADKMLTDADDAWCTLGHNRHATTGGKLYRSAHPFTFFDSAGDPTFAGMHNGTLTGWDSQKYISDTHWAMDKIQKVGIDAVKTMNGAFAYFWVDSEDDPNIINFVRNKERPMHMGFVKDKKVALFASESGMLYWLAERNDIELEEDSVLCLSTDTHYKFNIKDARKYTSTKLTGIITTPAATSSRGTTTLPDTTTTRPTGTYTVNDNQNRILSAISRAFEGTAGSVTRTLVSPNSAGVSPISGPSPAATTDNVIIGRMVTQEEIKAARTAGVYLKTVNFAPDQHDTTSNVFYGTVNEVGKAPTYSEIRNMHPTLVKQLSSCEVAVCKVIGLTTILANSTALADDDGAMLILSKPYELLMDDGTIIDRKVSTHIDETALIEEVNKADLEEVVSMEIDLTNDQPQQASITV